MEMDETSANLSASSSLSDGYSSDSDAHSVNSFQSDHSQVNACAAQMSQLSLPASPCSAPLNSKPLPPTSAPMDPIARYQVDRVLCDSLFGKVMTALDILHQRQVAIKLSNTDLVRAGSTVSGGRVIENPMDEAQLMRRIPPHNNVISLFDEHVSGNVHWMVMEYASKGEFFEFVSQQGALPAPTARRFLGQVASALAHIHKHGVCHLDVSMENMLVDEALNVKLADFGVARALPADGGMFPAIAGHKPGKLRYMAPEVLQAQAFDGRLADTFALGVILFAMLTGTSPFEAAHPNDKRWRLISAGRVADLLKMIQLDHLVSRTALDLLNRLLAPQQQRLQAHEILSHPFMCCA